MILVDPRSLRHIEDFDRDRVAWLKEKIVNEGIWTVPVCIERTHQLVLDGQHRMEVGLALGLERIPALLFDYDQVEVWSLREDEAVSRSLVIERAISGNIYPYKTAKHRFPGELPQLSVPLTDLGWPK